MGNAGFWTELVMVTSSYGRLDQVKQGRLGQARSSQGRLCTVDQVKLGQTRLFGSHTKQVISTTNE